MNLDLKNKKMLIPLACVIVVVLVAIIALAYNAHATRAMDNTDDTLIVVNIEEGSTTSDIAQVLQEEGLIRSTTIFKLHSRLKGYDGNYQAGVYAFDKTMSMQTIMKKIINGDTAGQTFTVIEGQALYKLAEQLEEAGICSQEDFYYEVQYGEFDYPFMSLLPSGVTRLEGFLFPDTYEVGLEATAHEVVDVMLAGFDQALTKAGIYDLVEEQGLDLYDVIVEASIVQREAGSVDEMELVASVIENRLAIEMPLQMDSIISYILQEDKIRATYSDISVESDYNPYTNYGLPPGPICAPGLDAILAALNPADTDYLYFVASADMDGSNVFSSTYADFLVDKAAFDAAYEEYVKEHPDVQ